MISINPKELKGNWFEGFALDFHTLSSEYIGDDEYGQPQFQTERSEVGELIFRLKYRSDRTVVKTLSLLAVDFLKSRQWPIEVIVPIPPSRSDRVFQPVHLLSEHIAKSLDLPIYKDCLIKTKNNPELKSVYDYDERIKILQGAYSVIPDDISGKALLLVDDLYRSGATLRVVTEALKNEGRAGSIYVMVFTKTRKIK